MIQVTAAEIISFVRSLDNRKLKTKARNKSFEVEVNTLGDGLVYIPESTGKPRPHNAKELSKFCQEFSRTNSLRPTDYTHITVNSVYVLTIVAAIIQSQRTS